MAKSLLKGVLLSGAVVESVIYISFLTHHCIATMFMIFTFHYISLFFILIKLQHLADYGFHFLSPPFSASHVVFLLLLILLGLLISHHGWDYFHYFFTFLALLMSHSGWKYDTSCANIRHFCHTSCISCTSCINHNNPSSVFNMYI